MGFYGNIQNSNKTAFTFDLIYSSRYAMEKATQIDGVFLGRYILVDYDEAPIQGWMNPADNWFYADSHYNTSSKITNPVPNVLYENLNASMVEVQRFYYYDATQNIFEEVTVNETTDGILISDSPYATSYTIDTRRYGRGYDSTVWQKTYDHTKQEYKYIMLAELNAKTPNFHLTVDPPTETPIAPYFDRDSTTMDYYLHLSPAYGHRVRFLNSIPDSDVEKTKIVADEKIDRTDIKYGYSSIGEATWEEVPQNDIPADIFYNKAGFEPGKRTFSDVTNTINYDKVASGRIYRKQDGPVYQGGEVFDDTYEWFFRLPAIGNAICTLWDKMYGYNNNNIRYREIAQKDSDTAAHLVTYDKSTMYGLLNNVRDLMGHQFIQKTNSLPANITNPSTTVSVTNKYDIAGVTETVNYIAINALYYELGDNGAIGSYWYYAYNPTFKQITAAPSLTGEYYFKDGDNYILANPALYNSTDANGNLLATDYTIYYTRQDRWTLTELDDTLPEDTLHGMIVKLHKLIGTGDIDTRDEKTLEGCINRIGDIISYIDLRLAPGRLMHTNNDGVIETTDTYFPSADWDKDELLAGDGNWVSRFSTVKVRQNSTNANRKLVKVVEFQDTDAASAAAPVELKNVQENGILVSDNQRYNEGTSLRNYKKHDPNTLILATRDKWIKLHPDATDDSIEFEHTQSPLVTNLTHQYYNDPAIIYKINNLEIFDENTENTTVNSTNFQAINNGTELLITTDSTNSLVYNGENADQNDNRLTIPIITVDNAGHIVAASTRNYNIPHGFKKVATTTVADNDEEKSEASSVDQAGTAIAETITDTLNLAPQNRWIDIATINNTAEGAAEDQITFGHRLVPTLNTSVTLNGTRRTSADIIPTVYRYGLPQDKSVAVLDAVNTNEAANTFNVPYIEVDKAGHIVAAETHVVTLPENFTKVTIEAASTSVGSGTTTGTAGATSDSNAGAGTVEADTLTDTLTLGASNKWIRIKSDATNDKITFGHEIHNIIASTSAEDMDTTNNDTFTTQVVQWDNAGHIISHNTKTWTLPNSIRNITVGVDSTSAANAGVNSSAVTVQADTTFDTINLNASNKWIRLAANADNDSITFGHLTQGTKGSYTGTDLNFTEFGGAVTLYGYETDEAGHIISNPTYTLTLPKGSYNESGGNVGANVLTSLSFTPTTGALVGTKANIGTLKITGYSTTGMTAQAIGASNTLNEALALLQLEINAETTRATNAESTLQNNLNTEASTRSSEDGKLQTAINTETTNRTNADDALQDAIDAVDGRVTTLSNNVYTKTNTYTKTEVDNAIGALYTKAQVDQAIKDAISAFATANGLTVPTT